MHDEEFNLAVLRISQCHHSFVCILFVQRKLFVRALQVQCSRSHSAVAFPVSMNCGSELNAVLQIEMHMSLVQTKFENCKSRPNYVVHGFQRNLVHRGESGVQLVFTEIVNRPDLALLFHAESSDR